MTEPTQKSLEEARELRAALSLGRDEYDAFMLVEEAEFDCKIALALDAARQSEWQDISTAPNGNIEFDAWANGRRYPNCHRHFGEILYWFTSLDDEPHWEALENATHWVLPPAPPSRPQP